MHGATLPDPTVWVLDNHMDKITPRRLRLVLKDLAPGRFGFVKEIRFFDTEQDALEAMMHRAGMAKLVAYSEVKKAEKRYIRCQNRWAHVGDPRG